MVILPIKKESFENQTQASNKVEAYSFDITIEHTECGFQNALAHQNDNVPLIEQLQLISDLSVSADIDSGNHIINSNVNIQNDLAGFSQNEPQPKKTEEG